MIPQRMKIGLWLATLLCIVAQPASAQNDADPIEDARLIERTATLPRDNLVLAVDWFEPKARLAPAASPMPLPTSSANAEDFASAIAYANQTRSSALLIWQGGQLLVEHYGLSAGPDTLSQSQSMHKSVVALMVAIAVDEGHIASLDDPATKYLGNWIAQPHGEITIQHLLTMTSGLELRPVGEQGVQAFGNRLFNASDIDAVAKSATQSRPPGEVFEYNNVNSQLLIAVLEAATATPYETFLSERLWSRIAADPGFLWLDRQDGTPHGYCCLIATARDWVRLGRLILDQGTAAGERIVSSERLIEALDPSAANPNYGHGIWRGTPFQPVRTYRPEGPFGIKHSAPFLAPDVFFFDGFGGQRVYIAPSRDLVIVRTGREVLEWDDAILPNAVIRALDARLAAVVARDCENCPAMQAIPAGIARLGSDEAEAERYDVPDMYAQRERPRIEVAITAPFAISRTEITNAQFAAFVSASGYEAEPGCWRFLGNRWEFDPLASWRRPGIPTAADYPVTCINAADAEAYSAWLAAETGLDYRLPSEAEWEYAARANRPGSTYWNDSMHDLCWFANPGDRSTAHAYGWEQTMPIVAEHAWHGAQCDDGFAALAPVASFAPNAFGLYDMIGNVNEWTADCFTPTHADHPAVQEPLWVAECDYRLLKGHTWTGNERTSRPAFRLRLKSDDRRFNLGFRIVRSISRPAAKQ